MRSQSSNVLLGSGRTTPQDYPENSGFAPRRERECGHRRHCAGANRRPHPCASISLAMPQRSEGATVDEVASAMGWQRHTVRGLFSGTLKKKLGLTLASTQEERGRVYRIAAPEQA